MSTNCAHEWVTTEVEMNCLDEDEVTLRCERNNAVSLRFAERHAATDPIDGRLFFLVQAKAAGFEARLEGVTNFATGTSLTRFLDSLDFRGWQGERRWVNADRDLKVGARYESGGHIALAWTLRPWRSRFKDWEATVTTWLEAGGAKDTLTAELHQFLTAEGHPIHYYESDEDFG